MVCYQAHIYLSPFEYLSHIRLALEFSLMLILVLFHVLQKVLCTGPEAQKIKQDSRTGSVVNQSYNRFVTFHLSLHTICMYLNIFVTFLHLFFTANKRSPTHDLNRYWWILKILGKQKTLEWVVFLYYVRFSCLVVIEQDLLSLRPGDWLWK